MKPRSIARIARIARWEVDRSTAVVDRRTLLLGVLALVVVGSVLGAGVLTGGVALDRDLYRVGVDESSPYYDPVASSTGLAVHPPSPDAFRAGDLDLLVREGGVVVRDTRKGQAALSALRASVERHNAGLMRAEENQTAAFPVVVSLRYATREEVTVLATTGSEGSDSDGGRDDDTVADTNGGGSFGGSTAGTDGDGPLAIPGIGTSVFAQDSVGSPADIDPPFPFGSLVLAFAFLVPMNFVIQAYGSTVLNERINRRGELLLVAPVSPAEIVAGKTLPYLGAMVGVTALIAVFVGGGVVSVAAVVPLALLFLASTFVGAMFARSFKELTFVTVTVSVFLTSYAFVPAIFTNVTPIALISPLSLVVRDLQGTGVDLASYLFSTGPIFLSATVLFGLGIGVYREEDMFTQRPVPLKFLDALDARLSGLGSVALLSALSIPFVFVAELLGVAVLFALPISVSIPLILVVVALVEEVAKSLHVLAGFEKGRFEPSVGSALALGTASGAGFFLGEKATAVVQLVGLPQLAVGRAAFAPAGTIGVEALPLALGLLAAPLVLHAVTASLSALGARGGFYPYLAGLGAAVVVHTTYNLTVVTLLG
ncbi:PrsW family intramembrane metalloprotease [Salinigranum sp. GCM10025319]|uniref:PrsW family intramembrane metalloprotease n=1 Tax=Salinigranum sp. GCM10025319 TaxID=3252687 RepID=UPI00361CC194